jgi:serine/threonine-protein kinase
MEYVEGLSCAEWISRTPPGMDSQTKHYLNLMIAYETCRALGYAHRNSILHRDLKPLNIFVSKYGRTKIGDFGLARYAEAVTREHTVWNFRSPAYSAPEQWRDEKSSKETDIYQLGCTLFHLFSGRLPFATTSVAALINAHLAQTADAPQSINPLISQPLGNVILKCLEKKRDDRPEVWEVVDTIVREIQRTFTLTIRFDKKNKDLIRAIADITDFNEQAMGKDGDFSWKFDDYNEALSETFELVLLGEVSIDLVIAPGRTTRAAAKP